MTASFSLPKCVNDRASGATDIVVVPHPGLGINRLTHRTQKTQAREVVVLCAAVGVASAALISERIAVGAV